MEHTFSAEFIEVIRDLSLRVEALTAFVAESLLYGSGKLEDETATLAELAHTTAAELYRMIDTKDA